VSTDNLGPVDASKTPRYAGIATFAKLPRIEEVEKAADIAVVGVPFDAGVSYRPGARFGPAHVQSHLASFVLITPLRTSHPSLGVRWSTPGTWSPTRSTCQKRSSR
jgi:agmatinase